MRRTILLIFLALLFILTAVTAGALSVAATGPIHVGDGLYPVQDLAEQALVKLTLNPAARANYLLNLVERRTHDLALASGKPFESAAVDALNRALEQALNSLTAVPSKDWPDLRSRLIKELALIAEVLKDTKQPINGILANLAQLQKAVNTLNFPLSDLARLFNLDKSAAAQADDTSSKAKGTPQPNDGTARTVQFQAGSSGAMHTFFLLTGKHATIECTSCHIDGKYAGTSKECAVCHAKKKPVKHYDGECSLCHSTEAWKPADFNHVAMKAVDCIACHAAKKPANHFSGQCGLCHSTDAWKPAKFDHGVANATDCQSCHNQDKPSGHFSGQCSACHGTSAWKPASFDHATANATNCEGCHSRPAKHFSGQCSNCHGTGGWLPARFDHANVTDCQSCHSRPNNHASGQCSH